MAATPSGGGRIDLHMHSTRSDGSHAPAELAAMALEAGLRAISLTDHDTLAGVDELREAAAGHDLDIVNGVELSSSAGHSDLHILGYLFDADDPRLVSELDRFRTGRRARVEKMVEVLNGMGVQVTLDDVLRHAAGGALGRPHVARALYELGYVETFDEAFRRYIGHHGKAFVPKPYFAPAEAIALIRSAGGVAVLAHPGTANRDELIPELVDAGLGGIEAWHPKHSPGQTLQYRRLARELGVVATGGSDFHGVAMGPVKIGTAEVPASVLEELRARR